MLASDDAYRPPGRYAASLMRAHFPEDGFLALGRAAELWLEQTDHPAWEWLNSRGGGAYRLTWNLLGDVLHAAGGVEYSAGRVLWLLDEGERWFASHHERHPEVGKFRQDVPHHVALPPALAWEYANLLTWLRTVEERIERRGRGRGPKLGLLPAIAEPELRVAVAGLRSAFQVQVGGERELANYALHAATIPQGTPSGRLNEDGTLTMAIPDPADEPIYIFDQFTYEQGRDLRTFTCQALGATESLIDRLFDAFQAANDRVRARRGGRVGAGEAESPTA